MILVILSIGVVMTGYRTIIAWTRPDKHQKHLEWWARRYSGWLPDGERWWRSKANFWIMRIAYALGFFMFLYGLLALIGSN